MPAARRPDGSAVPSPPADTGEGAPPIPAGMAILQFGVDVAGRPVGWDTSHARGILVIGDPSPQLDAVLDGFTIQAEQHGWPVRTINCDATQRPTQPRHPPGGPDPARPLLLLRGQFASASPTYWCPHVAIRNTRQDATMRVMSVPANRSSAPPRASVPGLALRMPATPSERPVRWLVAGHPYPQINTRIHVGDVGWIFPGQVTSSGPQAVVSRLVNHGAFDDVMEFAYTHREVCAWLAVCPVLPEEYRIMVALLNA